MNYIYITWITYSCLNYILLHHNNHLDRKLKYHFFFGIRAYYLHTLVRNVHYDSRKKEKYIHARIYDPRKKCSIRFDCEISTKHGERAALEIHKIAILRRVCGGLLQFGWRRALYGQKILPEVPFQFLTRGSVLPIVVLQFVRKFAAVASPRTWPEWIADASQRARSSVWPRVQLVNFFPSRNISAATRHDVMLANISVRERPDNSHNNRI